jgi:hypothetical protein
MKLAILDLSDANGLVFFAISEETEFKIVGEEEVRIGVIALHLLGFLGSIEVYIDVFGFGVPF